MKDNVSGLTSMISDYGTDMISSLLEPESCDTYLSAKFLQQPWTLAEKHKFLIHIKL